MEKVKEQKEIQKMCQFLKCGSSSVVWKYSATVVFEKTKKQDDVQGDVTFGLQLHPK